MQVLRFSFLLFGVLSVVAFALAFAMGKSASVAWWILVASLACLTIGVAFSPANGQQASNAPQANPGNNQPFQVPAWIGQLATGALNGVKEGALLIAGILLILIGIVVLYKTWLSWEGTNGAALLFLAGIACILAFGGVLATVAKMKEVWFVLLAIASLSAVALAWREGEWFWVGLAALFFIHAIAALIGEGKILLAWEGEVLAFPFLWWGKVLTGSYGPGVAVLAWGITCLGAGIASFHLLFERSEDLMVDIGKGLFAGFVVGTAVGVALIIFKPLDRRLNP